jgi:hypothetical protein
MDIKELRIGNLLMITHTREVFKVIKEHMADEDEQCLGESEPIPLTEEWHNKFGVELDGHMSFVYELPRKNNMFCKVSFSGDYVYLIQGKKPSDLYAVTVWNTDLSKRDMFVHEWQNLYHSLTSEELKIKI